MPLQLAASNVIQLENAKSGTTEWQLTNVALQHEIEGYASLTSVNRGGQISFYVNTAAPSYTIEVFRLGWYAGSGGRRMTEPVQRTGVQQVIPQPNAITGLIECNWTDPYVVDIPGNPNDPTDWASGVYVAKLTASGSNKQRYIVFVVRDDSSVSDYFFQTAVNTYAAYNNWGGKSLYDFNSTGGAAQKISFNRPYTGAYGEDGAGDFVQGWEYNMVRFLEREGFDVSYLTDVDAHSTPALLLSHNAHLIVGHNEYWSYEMRQGLLAARDQGIGIGVFAGDTMFWQIRYEPSNTNQANRTIVAYKETALTADPYFLDHDHSNDHLVTTHWRDTPVNLPEDALLGVGFVGELIDTDIIVSNPTHWVFGNTNLAVGDHLPGLLGYEVDGVLSNAPAGLTVLAHSPFTTDDAESGFSDMTVYTAASGSTVFTAGSIQWAWGVDDFDAPNFTSRVHPAAQQITRNVLARLIGNLPPTANSGGPYSGSGKVPLQFDGSSSSDSDGTVVEYLWDFGDGTSSNAQSPLHTYDAGGSFTVTLLVRDNRGSTNASITTATIAPPDLRMSLSTSNLSFAPQIVGRNGEVHEIVLTAIGSAPIDFISIPTTGDFSQSSNDCPASLISGAKCTISVQFFPTAEGLRTGNLTIQSTATASPQTVTLSGTGTVPHLSLSVSLLSFGGQNLGTSSSPVNVVITSTGTGPLDFAGFDLTGDFQQETNCPPTLLPGASCTVSFTFVPTVEGQRTGTFTLSSTEPGSPKTVALIGSGTVPHISVSVPSMTFALQPVNHAGPSQTLTITNPGTGPLIFSAIESGPNFALMNSCPTALAAGSSCDIQVTFTATGVGAINAALSIWSNASQTPTVVQLHGTAWDLALSLVRPTRQARNSASSANSFAIAIRADGARIPAEITCEVVPANFSCLVDITSLTVSSAPTIIQVSALSPSGSRAQRLRMAKDVSGTLMLRVDAGPFSRSIALPVNLR